MIAIQKIAVARSPAIYWLLFVCLGSISFSVAGAENVVVALNSAIKAPGIECDEPWLDERKLKNFYPDSDLKPLWVKWYGPSDRAWELRTRLLESEAEGLLPSRYRLQEIEQRWESSDNSELACLDMILTDAFARYVQDMQGGMIDPWEADPSWQIKVNEPDIPAITNSIDSVDDFRGVLESLAPQHRAYRLLRQAMSRYRQIARNGGWPTLPDGPPLEPGDAHFSVGILRQRLFLSGDLSAAETTDALFYDETLKQAVMRFQRRHGLSPDAIVGAQTRHALNVSVEERLAQLRRTMERWRWLPRHLGDQYIIVNTAGFDLRVIQSDQTRLAMKVIVGKLEQPTPSFATQALSFTINPYWNVPTRIVKEQLLPQQKRNPLFFTSREFRLYRYNGNELDPDSVDWSRIGADDVNFRLRQEPGPKNSLGRISFYTPNPFDIFLHDTPHPGLFRHDIRTFSEGCVRVEKPVELALSLLNGAGGWTQEKIRLEIESSRHQIIKIPEPVPIYVLYLTSWVDEAGETHFREDTYEREQSLSRYFPAEPVY